jgi:integrase
MKHQVSKDETRGTYYFVVDLPAVAGKRRQVKRRGFRSKSEAQRAMREVLNAGDAGNYVRPTSDTLGSFLVDRWLPTVRGNVKESTLHGYEKVVRSRILPAIGEARLRDLDAARLEAFYADLVSGGGRGVAGLSPKTVTNVAGVLSVALGEAVRWNLISRNPAKDAKTPRLRRPEMNAWTEQEAQVFLASVRSDRLFPLWRLALVTGLRRGELCGLRWSDLDLESGVLGVANTRVQARLVVEGPPKTESSRRSIALDRETVSVLRSWRATLASERLRAGEAWLDSGYVFVDELGHPPHPETVSRWWREAIGRAGVKPIRLHDARHTAATLLLRSRVPLKVVSQRLGHADVAITMRVYQHVTLADDQDAADTLAAALGDL